MPLDLAIARGADFGPVLISCQDAEGAAVPLAGWSAYAQARRSPAAAVVLDFAPVIAADDAAGLITLPALGHAATALLPAGIYAWDIILQDPAGIRYAPFLSGALAITTPTTQPATP